MTWAQFGRLRVTLTAAGIAVALVLAAAFWRSGGQDVAAQSPQAAGHSSKPLVRRDSAT